MRLIERLRTLFSHADTSEPVSGIDALPQVNGARYMRTLVREVDNGFESHSLFLRPQPDIDVEPLIAAVKSQLPENGSFMVTQEIEADESFDYYRISVSSFDLVSREQMEALAKGINAGLATATPSPVRIDRSPVPA